MRSHDGRKQQTRCRDAPLIASRAVRRIEPIATIGASIDLTTQCWLEIVSMNHTTKWLRRMDADSRVWSDLEPTTPHTTECINNAIQNAGS